MEKLEGYRVLVKTNCYAGNFEREMCAFMTGCIGECEVGEEFVDEGVREKFKGFIERKADDNGCFRPVEVGEDSNDFVIFFREEPSSEQIELMAERAKLFENTRPYKYLDEDFKFLGIEVLQITTVTKRKGYDKY